VIPRPGAQTTPAELRQFLQRELASFKIPRRILTLDQLPKGRRERFNGDRRVSRSTGCWVIRGDARAT
jgi:acyl-CoA synthetase (AMP-forming)/AMP-acid ligase II